MINSSNSRLFTIHSNKKSMNSNSTINVSIFLLDETSYDIQIDVSIILYYQLYAYFYQLLFIFVCFYSNQLNISLYIYKYFLSILFQTKNSIGDLFQKICEKLNLKEFDIFGLAQKQSESHFHLLLLFLFAQHSFCVLHI